MQAFGARPVAMRIRRGGRWTELSYQELAEMAEMLGELECVRRLRMNLTNKEEYACRLRRLGYDLGYQFAGDGARVGVESGCAGEGQRVALGGADAIEQVGVGAQAVGEGGEGLFEARVHLE